MILFTRKFPITLLVNVLADGYFNDTKGFHKKSNLKVRYLKCVFPCHKKPSLTSYIYYAQSKQHI